MNTQVVFKMDAKTKARAMQRAKREGVPFASVLRSAAERYAAGEFGMELVPTERFNKKTARAIRTAIRDVKAGKNVIAFKDADEMDAYLRSL